MAELVSAIVHVGNVIDILPTLEAGSVNCVVTSPPYWGLRDYGTASWDGGDAGCDHTVDRSGGIASSTLMGGKGTTNHQQEDRRRVCHCGARRIDSQLGIEPTPDLYVANMVAVFREVRRVLRDDGTLWLNLGDSYAGGGRGGNPDESPFRKQATNTGSVTGRAKEPGPVPDGLKPKDLCMIPARVALALQADGWYLRSDIIWAKPNPMPESVTDRPTKAHEYLFLLTKSARYWYDAEAIAERQWTGPHAPDNRARRTGGGQDFGDGSESRVWASNGTRNRRTVWTIATQPYPEAHFATYPEKLVEPCVLAGCPARVCSECGAPYIRVRERVSTGRRYSTGKSEAKNKAGLVTGFSGYDDGSSGPVYRTTGWDATCTCNAETVPGTVADFFAGSGTTGVVACRLGRNFVGIELSPEYAEMAERRIAPHRDQMQLAVTT